MLCVTNNLLVLVISYVDIGRWSDIYMLKNKAKNRQISNKIKHCLLYYLYYNMTDPRDSSLARVTNFGFKIFKLVKRCNP